MAFSRGPLGVICAWTDRALEHVFINPARFFRRVMEAEDRWSKNYQLQHELFETKLAHKDDELKQLQQLTQEQETKIEVSIFYFL